MEQSVASRFVGAWRLVSSEFRRSDGRVSYPYGPDAVGMLIYDAAGRMAVQIMRPDRPLFAAGDLMNGTAEEIRFAFERYVAYCGTFHVDEQEGAVTHEITASLFPNWVGQGQKRYFQFEGNRLTLTTPPSLAKGMTVTGVLIWERE
jgi:hypothetical protein